MRLFQKRLNVGIELGPTDIKMVGWRRNGGDISLRFCDRVDLTSLHDLTSFETPDSVLIKGLRTLLHRRPLAHVEISASLPATAAAISSLQLGPVESHDELLQSVQAEMYRHCAAPPGALVVRCQQMPALNGHQNTARLIACAVPIHELRRYRNIYEQAGLRLSSLELEAFGLYNAFEALHKPAPTWTALMHVGATSTICILSHPDRLPLFARLKTGGSFLTERLMTELTIDFRHAERLKQRMHTPEWTGRSTFANSHLQGLLSEFITVLAAEVKTWLGEIESNSGMDRIDGVYLTGSFASPVVRRLLAQELNVHVKLWDPISELLRTGKVMTEQHETVTQDFLPALGISLKDDA